MFQKTLLLLGLIVLTLGQIYNPGKLLFRYSFDQLPPEDAGAQLKGVPNTYGNPTSTQGKIGNGVRLNANGAQTDLFALGQYIIDAPITITAWFSVDSTALANPSQYFMKIFSNKWQYDDVQGLEIQFQPNGLWTIITPCAGAGSCDGALITYALPQNYTADDFHHIAVTYDEGNQVTVYLDNKLVVQKTASKALSGHSMQYVPSPPAPRDPPSPAAQGQNLHYLVVGGSLNGTQFNKGGEWHGVLDEVRVYNYTLSATEVGQVYGESSYAASSNNGGAQPLADVPCGATTSASPSLVVYNDLLPKDNNGDQLSAYPRNFITLHNNKITVDPVHQFSNPVPVHLFINNATTATLKNLGSSDVTISSFVLVDNVNFTVTNPPAPNTVLKAGSTLQFNIAFVGLLSVNIKTTFRTTMIISSNDPVQPTLTVHVVGLYMNEPEGSNEVTLSSILSAFGFGTFTALGAESYIQPVNWYYSLLLQDEVPGQYWRAADSSQPVNVHQLVAFGGQSQQYNIEPAHYFNIIYDQTGQLDCGQTVGQRWCNTIVPKCNFTGTDNTGDGEYLDCYSTCKPGDRRFYFSMDIQHTSVESQVAGDSTGYLQYLSSQISFKFFPVRLSDGTLVADTYIVAQDYSLPYACGDQPGQANCDYQDNIFVVSNIQPGDGNSATMSTLTLPLSFSFGSTVDGNVLDKNGNGLPFYDRFSTVYDTPHVLNSYDATALLLSTSANTLTISTRDGDLSTQKLTNGLRVNLNPQGSSFSVQTTFDASTVGSAYAGLLLGSDLFNSAALYVHNGQVTFTVQTQTGYQNTIDVFPTFTSSSSTPATMQIPSNVKNITLVIAVNPVNSTLTPMVGYPGSALTALPNSVFQLPGLVPGFGIGPAGRLTKFGVGAGIAAWNDAGASSSNVNFYNFAAYNCGGSFVQPTSSSPTSNTGSATTQTQSTNGDVKPTSTRATGTPMTGTASSTAVSIAAVAAVVALFL